MANKKSSSLKRKKPRNKPSTSATEFERIAQVVIKQVKGRGGSQALYGTTPETISQRISDWASQISLEKLVFLSPGKYSPGNCQLNCLFDHLQTKNEIVGGWIIWESSALLEGEYHCVMRDRNTGEYYDVTSTRDGEKRICFLPDFLNTSSMTNGSITTFDNLKFPHIIPIKTTRPVFLDPSPTSETLVYSKTPNVSEQARDIHIALFRQLNPSVAIRAS